MEKKLDNQIDTEFNNLRKFGFNVFSFNCRNTLSFGMKYFVNHIIVSKKYLIFVEVNPDKEILSEDKKELQLFLSHLSALNKSLHFRIIRNMKDCKELTELLIAKKL